MGVLADLLAPSGLTPHGLRILWQSGPIWLQALSDAAIALACFSIALALTNFVARRWDFGFHLVPLLAAALILFCGLTHLMGAVTLWLPAYELEGVLKAITAVMSLAAAVLVWTWMPRALAYPSPTALSQANGLLSLRIGESEEAQRRLRTNEARQRQMIVGLPAALYSLDLDGRLTEASDYMADLIGRRRDEIIGRDIAAFLPASQVATRKEALELTIRDGEVRELESQFLHASGSVIDVSISSRLQRGEAGQAEFALCVVTDVTARRQAEAALRDSEERLRQSQKMEAIGELTGGIAHDFNNMLTVIEGNLERLAAQFGDDEEPGLLVRQASLAAQRADRLVEQLLAFSRLQRLDPRPTDVRAVVEGLRGLLVGGVDEQVSLVIEEAGEEAASCWPCFADRNQLEAALVNLVINAAQAIRDKGEVDGLIRISITDARLGVADRWRDGGGESPQAGDYVRLCVIDNGIGMSEDVRTRALEPFFTTRPTGRGTGLGLSQTYGFVRQSHGAMRIDSAVGRGTTVEILLPRSPYAVAEQDIAPLVALGARTLPTVAGSDLLLVVEDEAAVLDVAASSLRESGYEVATAADAEEALRVLAAHPEVALVFTDIVMPGQTGVALAVELWKIRPGLPIIFASGYSDETLTRQLPPDARFFKKPYRISAVVASIQDALAERAATGPLGVLR